MYRIERTVLTDGSGRNALRYDLAPYLVTAPDACSAVGRFLEQDEATAAAAPCALPGDKATGSGTRDGCFFVVYAERADEALRFPSDAAARTTAP